MESRGEDYKARLIAVATRLRKSGALGRSDPLMRLLDYLLKCSLKGCVPKEVEIAREVFGKNAGFDILQDASVRVYIHRLRRKLEGFNARLGAQQDRIVLPLGEYQLTLLKAEIPQEDSLAASLPGETSHLAASLCGRPHARFWIVAALFLLINMGGWLAYYGPGRTAPAVVTAKTGLWRPFSESRTPTLLATGDYYIFGDEQDTPDVTRLVRDFTINSHGDLETYLTTHPDMRRRYVDLDLHYLPTSIAPALRELVPVIDAAGLAAGKRPHIVSNSAVSGDMLKNANVVYLGYLSGLGMLRDPVFRASGFELGVNYDELIDRQSRRRYISDWSLVIDGKSGQRDFAYIASFPGPAGNRILIVSGTRDAAVVQAAQIVADATQVAQITDRAKADSFEALYEVRTLGGVNLRSSLIVARPLHAERAWHSGSSPSR